MVLRVTERSTGSDTRQGAEKSKIATETQSHREGEGIRTYQKCQQILTLLVLIFLCVSVSLRLVLVFHQPARR